MPSTRLNTTSTSIISHMRSGNRRRTCSSGRDRREQPSRRPRRSPRNWIQFGFCVVGQRQRSDRHLQRPADGDRRRRVQAADASEGSQRRPRGHHQRWRCHGLLCAVSRPGVPGGQGDHRESGGSVAIRSGGHMKVNRRRFGTFLAGAVGSFAAGSKAAASRSQAPAPLARAAARLPAATVTKIRVFYPPNYNANGPQAFPQSNMVVLVDTEAGITGIGQGGSPDTVRNVARSVIGKNAFDTEMIWQAVFMDGFYSPGKERLHALGAIDLALWDIKGKALNAPLYQLFGGKAREHLELYATSGLPQGLVPPEEAAAMGLKERAAATMKAGYRVYRVDGGILPSTGRAGAGATGGAAAGGRGGSPSSPPGAGGRGG